MLKVIHVELTRLTTRMGALEEEIKELKEGADITFTLGSEDDGGAGSSEEWSDEESEESEASAYSAPPSFQYKE